MRALIERWSPPHRAAALIFVIATATLGAALFFQHVIGLVPCKLCLQQRYPYHVVIALAFGLAVLPLRDAWRRTGLLIVALVLFVSVGLGVHHAGVEWGFWPGPNDCGGASPSAPGGMADFMKQLETTRVISCTEAAWRFLGLSMAGWNALVSLGLAGLALSAGLRLGNRQA